MEYQSCSTIKVMRMHFLYCKHLSPSASTLRLADVKSNYLFVFGTLQRILSVKQIQSFLCVSKFAYSKTFSNWRLIIATVSELQKTQKGSPTLFWFCNYIFSIKQFSSRCVVAGRLKAE